MRRALVAVPIAGCAVAAAQSPPTGSFSVTPAYQANSALDSGGNVGYTAVYTTFGESWSLDARSTLRLGLSLDYEDWRFSNNAAFGGRPPWGDLYRFGISLPTATRARAAGVGRYLRPSSIRANRVPSCPMRWNTARWSRAPGAGATI